MENLVVGKVEFNKSEICGFIDKVAREYNGKVKITLYGDVVVKKNQKRIFWNKRSGRPFITSSAKYKQYEKDVAVQITGEKKGKFTDEDKIVLKVLWFPSNNRQDIDNVITSVMDIMQDNGVISNDGHIVKIEAEKVGVDKTNPHIDIELYALQENI